MILSQVLQSLNIFWILEFIYFYLFLYSPAGLASLKDYEAVLRGVSYAHSNPSSERRITVHCTELNGRFLSNDFDVRVSQNMLFSQSALGLFTQEQITFRKLFQIVILTLSWFESLILPFVNAKLFQIRLLKREKNSVLDRDPPRKPDSDNLWTQSSFGTWIVHAHFGNARWSHACTCMGQSAQ